MTSNGQSQVVAGRYRLLRTLGSGAHGTVDLAEDLLNGGHRVAVKRLEAIVGAGDPEPAAEVLRWFLHPRWAEVLDEGRLDAHGRFQVTRYVPGHSLDRIELPRPADEVMRFLEDGARALRALHSHGLIHYDVTLGNFLREEVPGGVQFTLTDGGLASVGPVRGVARGTPQFMAPEVLEGTAHDHRADLFALGLVAWRLATGADPHGAGGAGEVLGRRRRVPAPLLRSVRPDAPAGLERVIAALLEIDPQRRPADGAAVLDMLAEAGWDPARVALLPEEAAAAATSGALIGRDAAITRLRDACRALVTDVTPPAPIDDPTGATQRPPTPDSVMIVHGPSGSGATRLLQQMAAVARAEGVPVLEVNAREGAADRRSAVRRVADALGALLSDGGAARLGEGKSGRADADVQAAASARAVERFIELCERAAAKSPVALLVEDFAELDGASQEGFRVLSRHLLARAEHPDGRRPPRLLLVVDHGTEDPEAMLIPDAADTRRPCIHLEPMTDAEMGAIVADRLPGFEGPPADLAALRAACDGRPRTLVGLLAEGLRRGDARRIDSRWIWATEDLRTYRPPTRIPPPIQRALDDAPPAVRAAVTRLALLEEPAPMPFVDALAGPEIATRLAASTLVTRSHEGDSVRLAPSSRGLRDSLRDLPPDELAGHRRALLDALRRAPSEELVPDEARLLAAEGDDAGALRRLLEPTPEPEPAADVGDSPRRQERDLARSAASPSAAARRRRLPVLADLLDAHPDIASSPSLRAAAASLLLSGPAGTRVSDRLAAAVLSAASPEDDETRVVLAEDAYSRHHYARVLELLASPIRSSEPTLLARTAVADLRARVALDPQGIDRAIVIDRLRVVRRLGPAARRACPSATVGALLALTRYHYEHDDVPLAELLCRRALRRARQARQPRLTLQAYNALALCAQHRGAYIDAERLLGRAIRLRSVLGELASSAGNLQNLAVLKSKRGAHLDAAAVLARAASIGVRHARHGDASLSLITLAELYDSRGNLTLALQAVRRASSLAAAADVSSLHVESLAYLASLLLHSGHARECRTLLSNAAALIRQPAHRRLRPIFATIAASVRLGMGHYKCSAAYLTRSQQQRPAAGTTFTALRTFSRLRPELGLRQHLDVPARNPAASIAFRRVLARVLRLLRNPRSGGEARALLLSQALSADAALTGPEHRAILETLLVASRSANRLSQSLLPLLHVAIRASALRGESLLRSRFELVLAVLSRRAGDHSGARTWLSHALANCHSIDGQRVDAVAQLGRARFLPPEYQWAALELAEAPPPSPAIAAQSSAVSTQLHAIAHQLSMENAVGPEHDARIPVALRTVLSISAQLRAGAGLEALLDSLTDGARRITAAERACVILVTPGGTGDVRVVSTSSDLEARERRQGLSHTIIQRVLSTGKPLLLHDTFGDSELMGRPSVASLSLRSVLCVPLARGERLYGALYADSGAGAGTFDGVDLEIFSLFAEQASAAIETARLLSDVQRSLSDLRATQDKLVRGERLRVMGELASGVAHEFNNLLTAILARLQLLGLEPLPPNMRHELGMIQKAALDAAEVVRRLQTFSRTQRQSEFQRVDMGEIAADVIEFLRPLSAGRRLTGKPAVSVHLRAARGHVVLGDATELREILMNLIKNAIEAVDAGGAVVVSTSERGGSVRVLVEDNGPGIPAELRTRLFTPFFTTKGDRGTGLGLCLSQQIAERHGGELRLESRSDHGTVATLTIPAAPPSDAQSTQPPAEQLVPEKNLSVLVVDDDPNVLEPLCGFLRRSGLAVRGALGGTEALRLVNAGTPDVVITDFGMPGMDGLELCRSLRKDHPALPIILMTGRASALDLNRANESLASAVLSKPFTMRQVLDLLAAYATDMGSAPPTRDS